VNPCRAMLPSSAILTALLLAALLATRPGAAQTPSCDALPTEARNVARAVLESQPPYEGCDQPIATCLKTTPADGLARRLADFVCRRAASKQDQATIQRSLERRALSMMRPGRVHTIDDTWWPVAGCTAAKVKVVAYVCARCPFCSKLLPDLYREVTTGRLAGRVALTVRPFPIKSHAHSTEANLAVTAAAGLGKAWEYLLHAYRHFDAFTPDATGRWAAEAGLDGAAFAAAASGSTARDLLVAAKKEGLKNGVEATPTLFINGRRYLGDLDPETLLDVLEEELEAAR
jgi:protein-disulfide isomerase